MVAKSYVLFQLYDKLNCGEVLRRDEVLREYEISISTFRRYIALLREYYRDCYGKDVVYVSKTETYRLRERKSVPLS